VNRELATQAENADAGEGEDEGGIPKGKKGIAAMSSEPAPLSRNLLNAFQLLGVNLVRQPMPFIGIKPVSTLRQKCHCCETSTRFN
jgi:hypothetical protein